MARLTKEKSEDILINGNGWANAAAIEFATEEMKLSHSEFVLINGDGVDNALAMKHASTPEMKERHSNFVLEQDEVWANAFAMEFADPEQCKHHSDLVLNSTGVQNGVPANVIALSAKNATPEQKERHSGRLLESGDIEDNLSAIDYASPEMKLLHQERADELQEIQDAGIAEQEKTQPEARMIILTSDEESLVILQGGDGWLNAKAIANAAPDQRKNHSDVVLNNGNAGDNILARNNSVDPAMKQAHQDRFNELNQANEQEPS